MNLKTLKFKNLEIVILFFMFSIIYLFLPNNNSTLDAWGYASDVKFAKDLFNPHHILYNPFFLFLTKLVKQFAPSFDVLKLMQLTNGLFAIFSLHLLYKILKLSTLNENQINMWLFFVGSSFAVLRYGTENETYIIPIYFSLLSSFYYYKHSKEKSKLIDVLLSGIFGSIACLFHQTHIFWLFGIFMGFVFTKNRKLIFLFFTTTLIIPLTYVGILAAITPKNLSLNYLFQFILNDYHIGSASASISTINFILTPVSFFRSFFQVHGIILDFIRINSITSILSILLVVYFFQKSIFHKKVIFKRNKTLIFNKIHLGIFFLQITFAFISQGNAEFMVMIPFLIPLFIPFYVEVNFKSIKYLSIAMLIWNLSFAIIPNHRYDYFNNDKLIEIIHDNPDKIFLLREKNKIINKYFYTFGKTISNRVFDKSDDLKLLKNKVVYTDILTKKMPYNRASMVEKDQDINFIFMNHAEEIPCFLGNYYMDEIKISSNK